MNTSTELCGPSKAMTLCLPAAASGVLLPLLVLYFCVGVNKYMLILMLCCSGRRPLRAADEFTGMFFLVFGVMVMGSRHSCLVCSQSVVLFPMMYHSSLWLFPGLHRPHGAFVPCFVPWCPHFVRLHDERSGWCDGPSVSFLRPGSRTLYLLHQVSGIVADDAVFSPD